MEDFGKLVDYLKNLADGTNAGKAWVDFSFEDGSAVRIEYKPTKRRAK